VLVAHTEQYLFDTNKSNLLAVPNITPTSELVYKSSYLLQPTSTTTVMAGTLLS